MTLLRKKLNKNKKKINVSIIIPYYKKKNFFLKTIKSILKQSYKNYEIILIYDDLDLEELKFVEKCLNKIRNKRIIINKNKLGAGFSRNVGIRIAKGKFISFCDADDEWKKKKLEDQLYFMKRNNYEFTHTSYSIIGEKSELRGFFKVKEKINYDGLLKSCDVGLSTVICKKSLLIKNNFTSLKTKEDYSLWLKILRSKKILYGLNKNLVSWRITNKSLSSSILQKTIDSFRLYYYYEGYNFFMSIYLTLRLIINAVLKKINIYI